MKIAVFVSTALVLLNAPGASADPLQNSEQARQIMGIVQATIAYCPTIEARSGILGVLYESISTLKDEEDVATAKQAAFSLLRGASSRDVACELMMQDYGPGGSPELFQFR